MSIGGVALSYDLNARSYEADLLQAQYFQEVLAAQRDDLAANRARHTALFGHAELAHDESRMQYARREFQVLESEMRKLAVMLHALRRRFPGLAND